MSLRSEALEDLVQRRLTERRELDQLRIRRIVQSIDSIHARIDGRFVTLFAGNDYLGLTHHPKIIEAVTQSVQRDGAGSGSAGLICGYTTEHAAAERDIAVWKGVEACVLLSSGYQANFAAIQTFAELGEHHSGGVRFLVDKLAHASLIDAVRATTQPFRVFPHNHLGKLQRLLRDADAGQLQVVVTESVFSMDGDFADLKGLAELKRQHPFALLLDEAHGTGVYGSDGRGLAFEFDVQEMVDVSILTLSKSVGCIGGAVCARRGFVDALINFGRAYVYSTSVPASVAATARAAIGVMRDEPRRQARVRELAMRVRSTLHGRVAGASDCPIVPLILGQETAALQASDRLLEKGIFVPAVRPPSVPPGGSRLRITLSCEHTDTEVDALLDALCL